jgi:hypothetical protein
VLGGQERGWGAISATCQSEDGMSTIEGAVDGEQRGVREGDDE